MTSKTNLRWLKQLEYPLQTVFETWASKSTSRCKSLLHQCVVFHLREPSICSQQEFDQSLVATSEFPGASQKIGKSSSIGLHRVHLGDEDSTLFLRLDPRASYRIIDSLLGSRTYSDSPTAVAFSTLDWQVLSYAMGELLGALQEAWEPIAPIYPKLHAFSPEEDIHRWVPTDSFLLRLEFDLKLNSDDAEGENTHPVSAAGSWYLPAASLTKHLTALLSVSQGSNYKKPAVAGISQTAKKPPLLVTVARSTIRRVDLKQLEVGDIIATEQLADGVAEIEFGGKVLFRGKPGTYHGAKAISITEAVHPCSKPTKSTKPTNAIPSTASN